jgi:hypothetical protein
VFNISVIITLVADKAPIKCLILIRINIKIPYTERNTVKLCSKNNKNILYIYSWFYLHKSKQDLKFCLVLLHFLFSPILKSREDNVSEIRAVSVLKQMRIHLLGICCVPLKKLTKINKLIQKR